MKHLSTLLALAVLVMANLPGHPISEKAAPAAERVGDGENPFDWLVGTWVGEGLGGVVEETWLPMSAGSMLGMFRLVAGGKTVLYELVTIAKRGESFEMRLKHFHPDLASWEEKTESLVWPLESREEGRVRFGPTEYALEKDGSLRVWVEIEQDGKTETEELVFQKVGSTAAAASR